MDPPASGIVTEHLRNLIAKQVEDHGLVVCYDPEGHYRDVAEDLDLPDTTIARYNDSFFALRHQISHLLSGLNPPRMVIYVPLDQASARNALIELESAGVVLQPGQQPPSRNTQPSVVARNALKPILSEESAADVEKQVEAGIALVVAIYSAIQRHSALAGLLILGDLSIQGNIKAVRSLVEPLQVGMDNGARRALIPLENTRNFLEVSGDLVERVDPVFYSDPLTAAIKGLGLT